MGRREDLRRQIERAEQELIKLESLPDLAAMPQGTVLAVAVTQHSGRTKQYVGLKQKGGFWSFTDKAPRLTSDQATDWLWDGSRQAVAVQVLGQIEVIEMPKVDLDVLLLNSLADRHLEPQGSYGEDLR